ncbi:MAG: hypothetical protein C0412_12025 [Flavobacterium sp.]|nr:hypothetical protein [Flavobacterium sp.]
MKKLIFLIMIAGLSLASIAAVEFPGCSTNNYSVQNTQNSKEFNVKPGGNLKLDLQSGGDIEIEGWNKDIVSIEIKSHGRGSNIDSYDIRQEGNNITFNNKKRGKQTDVFVKVPNKFSVDFYTIGGDVKITSVDGKLEGKTMGGDLEFRKLKGYMDITTMGGEITLKDSEVDGKVETMGGEVLVENVKGDINASSMGGNVQHINVTGRNKTVGKEVDISTMGGDLDLDKAPNGAKLHTMGGDITINHADKFVNAQTMGGDIKIKEVDGWVKAKTLGGNIKVKMVGNPKEGKRDIELTSLSGDITLIVPAGLSMDIDIELVYTKKHSDCKIISDFNIKEDRTKEWDDENGTPRKYIYGKGSVGGGKNKITIHTINGNVYLKKG